MSLGKKGEVGENPVFDKDDDSPKKKKKKDDDKEEDCSEGSKLPDRSFDAFAMAADKLKGTIPEMMWRAREKAYELEDKEEDDEEEDEEDTEKDSSHGEENKEGYHKKWKDLQNIAKDRDKKDKKDSDDHSSDSDGAT